MYRNKRLGLLLPLCGLIIAAIGLWPFLFSTIQKTSIPSLFTLQQTGDANYGSTFFFSVMLFAILPIAYLRRRKRIRVAVGVLLGLISYFCWFSSTIWVEYNNIDLNEQRVIAILVWTFAIIIILITKSARKQKRKMFSQAVKREVIHKQKGKCAICKRKLQSYGLDFHHKNQDRSNNKISNCEVLCTVCHRRKHSIE
jgi:TctA family transporter